MILRWKNILALFTVACLFAPLPAKAAKAAEMVVILHGIAKTGSSMKSLERALQGAGYDTLSITYPSTERDLDGIADWLRQTQLTEGFWNENDTVHIVAHSMGGLVARRYLDRYQETVPRDHLGAVVMLAPPNGGSEVADLIHNLPPYKWYYGPAGAELTTAAQAVNHSDIHYDLGIIAGTKEWPYIAAAFVVPGKSDGRVSVENTKLAGMKDHITVNATHTFIMDKPDVHKQVLSFLKHRKFDHET